MRSEVGKMELLEEITAYVDNELNDFLVVFRLKELIAVDYELKKEYIIQKSIKDLLNSRLSNGKCNSLLFERLRREIYNEINCLSKIK